MRATTLLSILATISIAVAAPAPNGDLRPQPTPHGTEVAAAPAVTSAGAPPASAPKDEHEHEHNKPVTATLAPPEDLKPKPTLPGTTVVAPPQQTSVKSAKPAAKGANGCPVGKSKQCCTSLNKTGNSIVAPLSQLLPVGGLKLSSIIGLSCIEMGPNNPDHTCLDDIMCCSGASPNALGVEIGCKPMDKPNEKAAIELEKPK